MAEKTGDRDLERSGLRRPHREDSAVLERKEPHLEPMCRKDTQEVAARVESRWASQG
jgi:hypothetical protein